MIQCVHMTSILKYITKGLLVLLPVFVIIWIFIAVLSILQRVSPETSIGIIILVGVIISGCIGWIAEKGILFGIRSMITRRLGIHAPRLLAVFNIANKFPLLSTSSDTLNNPVWIHTSDKQRKIGFLIHESLDAFTLPDHVSVIIPSSFSLQAECIVVHKNSIEKIDRDAEATLLFSITGGLSDTMKKE
jgi:uncharacterized membrane protein